jgi:Domain of unknown function (DUF1905)
VSRHRFDAVLGAGEDDDLPAVVLPAEAAAAMGGRARIPVTGSINGVPFRSSTMPMGDGTHGTHGAPARASEAETNRGQAPVGLSATFVAVL